MYSYRPMKILRLNQFVIEYDLDFHIWAVCKASNYYFGCIRECHQLISRIVWDPSLTPGVFQKMQGIPWTHDHRCIHTVFCFLDVWQKTLIEVGQSPFYGSFVIVCSDLHDRMPLQNQRKLRIISHMRCVIWPALDRENIKLILCV